MSIWILTLLLGLPLQLAQDAGDEESPDAIVQRIRETQQRIDERLLEAADSDRGGFAEILQAVRDQHLGVIRDLEELIKQAKYSASQQGSSGGESSSDSDSPPPPDSSDSPSRQSDGADAPDPSEGSTSPPESGGEGQQDEPQGASDSQPAGGMPEDSSGSDQEAGGPPPPDPIEPVTRQDTDDRWGLLPPKLQERLMNLHVDDVPARYRSWLEAYVRSMNALEQRKGP